MYTTAQGTACGSDGWTVLDTMLMEDRLSFLPGSIYDISGCREMISGFGILAGTDGIKPHRESPQHGGQHVYSI